jgi:DNA invertase Pin-like site-specific DNA recombinase
MSLKAILYCRKSTDTEEKQERSLEDQQFELEAIAEREGIEIVRVLTEKKSAKAPGRPIFADMLSLINSGQADTILCWKLDRLARNPIDGGTISWILQQNQIKSIVTYDRTYLPTDNILMMSLEFGSSNQFVRDLSANVKRGYENKVRRGEWPNRAPYGYKNDKNIKNLKVVKAEAQKVQGLFELYATGTYGMKQLAKLYGVHTSQIALRLSRHVYYGMIEYKGELYPGIFKPVISKELFDQVQEVKNGARVSPSRSKGLTFPYRGFMTCAVCGCMLTASRKRGHLDYYYCTNGKVGCTQHKSYLTEKQTDALFTEALEKIQFDEEIIEIMYEAARVRHENGRYSGQQTLDAIQYQIHQLKTKEKKLLQTYTDNLIDKDLYTEEASALQKEKRILQTKHRNYAANADNGLATLEHTKEAFLASNNKLYDFSAADPEEKQKIVENVLWNIEVKDKKPLCFKYKSYYEVLANAPKNGDLAIMLPDRDSN